MQVVQQRQYETEQILHGVGGGSSIVKVPGDMPPIRVYLFGLLV